MIKMTIKIKSAAPIVGGSLHNLNLHLNLNTYEQDHDAT
jgi:hypothetical protein